MPDYMEKRRYPRIFFPAGQKIEAEIVHEASGWSLAVTLLDISEGGMGMRLKRNADVSIVPGECIRLETIHGQPYLRALSQITMDVRWILDDDFFDYIALGCQFLDLPQKDRELLHDFTLLSLAAGREELDGAP